MTEPRRRRAPCRPRAAAGTAGAAAAARRRAPSIDDLEEAMRDVVDPELGINVVDLGLVYGIRRRQDNTATIDMTLTSAACPLTDVIEDQARAALTGGRRRPRRRHPDQLGLDAAVGSGEDHRGRPGAAAGARLPRLSPRPQLLRQRPRARRRVSHPSTCPRFFRVHPQGLPARG